MRPARLASLRALFVPAVLLAAEGAAHAQECARSVCATVAVSEAPPSVSITFDPRSIACTIAPRIGTLVNGTPEWGPSVRLETAPLTYAETGVALGFSREYSVRCWMMDGGAQIQQSTTISVGLRAEDAEDSGVVAIVVDAPNAVALAPELDRLETDMIAEGYGVVREVFDPATTTHTTLRSALAARRATLGLRLKYALLLGRVPRVFSGNGGYDGHSDTTGGWPTDTYYADLDGTWTDTMTYGAPANRHYNVPGDGMFDQIRPPSALELAVGRVDAEEMPVFAPLTSTDLLRRYLEKNHAYRAGQVKLARRAWRTNTFGGTVGSYEVEPPTVHASRSLYGAGPQVGADFFGGLADPAGYALAFGSGAGGPSSASGVATSALFATSPVNAGFLGLFGSYFGDYSFSNNLMRAALFGPNAVVGTGWFSRPALVAHRLGALGTFGDLALDTTTTSLGFLLLGDPTLRMDPVSPPTAVSARCERGRPTVSWGSSPDANVGYRVFRREVGQPSTAPETRVSGATTTSPFVDTSADGDKAYTYRVVPVRHLTTGSGTFVKLGYGAGAKTDGCGPVPPEPPPSPTTPPTTSPTVPPSTGPVTPAPSGAQPSPSAPSPAVDGDTTLEGGGCGLSGARVNGEGAAGFAANGLAVALVGFRLRRPGSRLRRTDG
ncbi:MAG: C25 family cysteine peptidase [Polyangiaceae bacterium]